MEKKRKEANRRMAILQLALFELETNVEITLCHLSAIHSNPADNEDYLQHILLLEDVREWRREIIAAIK